MKRPLFVLVILFSMFVFSAYGVEAMPKLAVTPGSFGVAYIPGEVSEFQVFIEGNPYDQLTVEAQGELADYLEILTPEIDLGVAGRAQALFRFTVPVIDMPGTHSAIVAIREKPPLRGFGEPAPTITATAAIGVPVRVYMPCPDRCIALTFNVEDVALGEPALFTAQVSNAGSNPIGTIGGHIEVLDDSGSVVANLPFTSSQSLAPSGNVALHSEWDTTGAAIGVYTAKAVVLYDEFSKEAKDDFRLGELLIRILSVSPRTFTQDEVASISALIESVWNKPITDIYGVFRFKTLEGEEVAQVTTPTMASMAPWSKSSLNALLDIRSQPIGNYTLSTEVFYEGRNASADFPAYIVEKQLVETQFKLDPSVIIIFALLMLIVILIYLRERKKHA